MVGVIVTLVVIAAVAYCVLKNYYPPIILLLASRYRYAHLRFHDGRDACG